MKYSSKQRGRSKRREEDSYGDGTYFTDDYSHDYTNDYSYYSEDSRANDSRTFDSRLDLSESVSE